MGQQIFINKNELHNKGQVKDQVKRLFTFLTTTTRVTNVCHFKQQLKLSSKLLTKKNMNNLTLQMFVKEKRKHFLKTKINQNFYSNSNCFIIFVTKKSWKSKHLSLIIQIIGTTKKFWISQFSKGVFEILKL